MRSAHSYPALLALIAVAALASSCGETKREFHTVTDVRETFADQGLRLETYEVGPGIPALGYPIGAKGEARRVVCLVFADSTTARGYLKSIVGAGSISRALRARNVAVLVTPAATPDDVRRTLRAVAELKRR